MPYYPSNKIITNLVSEGEYYLFANNIDNTNNGIDTFNQTNNDGNNNIVEINPEDRGGNSPYFGNYYLLYNGQAYTGRFPGDGENTLLVKTDYSTSQRSTLVQSLKSSPYLSFEPTDEDYENGIFTRYFSKKRNEFVYRELSKNEYDDLNKINNPLYASYRTFFLDWKLVGFQQELINYNFFSVKEIEEGEDALGFSKFLKDDYLKYTIIKIGNRW